MKISTKIYLRSDQSSRSGEQSLYLQVIKDRRKKYVFLGVRINPKYWNKDRLKVRSGCSRYDSYNRLILAYQGRVSKILLDAEFKGLDLSLDEFCRLFRLDDSSNSSLYNYIELDIKNITGVYSGETVRMYKAQLSKLRSFAPSLYFRDVSVDFLKRYQQFLVSKRGNGHNTISKAMAWLKSIISKARAEGVTDVNPYANYKISAIVGDRSHLSLNDLKKLDQIYDDPETQIKYRNVLQYFLFCCYTGLRYGDIKTLRYANLENYIIRMCQNKTSGYVSIPIIDQARRYLGSGRKSELCFRVISNQKTNDYLKAIIKEAGINKEISFHCARHTFATIGLDAGIPIDVVSKLLGHTSLKTTQIYAKYSDKRKIDEIEKIQQVIQTSTNLD